MTTEKDGGPAFPCDDVIRRDAKGHLYGPAISSAGMTLRDYFAAKAMPMGMQRLKENYSKDMEDWSWTDYDFDAIAEHAYSMADAMLLVRAK